VEASHELKSTAGREAAAPHVIEVESVVELGEVASERRERPVVLVDQL
jgi:hypothetical protein